MNRDDRTGTPNALAFPRGTVFSPATTGGHAMTIHDRFASPLRSRAALALLFASLLSGCASTAAVTDRAGVALQPDATPPERRVVLVGARFDLRDHLFGSREGWNEKAKNLATGAITDRLSTEGLALMVAGEPPAPGADEPSAQPAPCAGEARDSMECANDIRDRYGAQYGLFLDAGGEYGSAASVAATAVGTPALIYVGVVGGMALGIVGVMTLPVWMPIALIAEHREKERAESGMAEAPMEEPKPVAESEPPKMHIPPGASVSLKDLKSGAIVWSNRIYAVDWRDEASVKLGVEALLAGFTLSRPTGTGSPTIETTDACSEDPCE
jgi:hypothetical protein